MCSRYHLDQFKFFISPGECLQFVFLSTDPDTMHLIPFCLYPRKDVRSAGGRGSSLHSYQRSAVPWEKEQSSSTEIPFYVECVFPFCGLLEFVFIPQVLLHSCCSVHTQLPCEELF